jgi:hypothetical protein
MTTCVADANCGDEIQMPTDTSEIHFLSLAMLSVVTGLIFLGYLSS